MSATKRARYNGPSGTGVDLTDVELVDGQVRAAHVPHGGLLPTEIGDVAVSAEYRDRLLKQADWSDVRQSSGGGSNGPTKKDLASQAAARGIDVPTGATKADIQQLLDAPQGAGGEDQAGAEPANDDGAPGAESTEG